MNSKNQAVVSTATPNWQIILGLQEGGVIKVPVICDVSPEINRPCPEIENRKHIVIGVEKCNPDRVLDLMISTEIPGKNTEELYIIRYISHPEVHDLSSNIENKLIQGITEQDLDKILGSMMEDGSKILGVTKYKAKKQWEHIEKPIRLSKGNPFWD